MDGWLDLAEFAEKYSVSQSTLRRRIRARSIEFKLERGKYLLADKIETLNAAPLYSRSSDQASKTTERAPRLTISSRATSTPPAAKSVEAPKLPSLNPDDLPDPVQEFLSSAELLPITLRGEYERLLIENRTLRREVAELQTLVKALEAEIL